MKQMNVKVKIVSQLTAVVTVVVVFIMGSWNEWKITDSYSALPTLQSETIALAKFISGVDISQPSQIFEHEQAVMKQRLHSHTEDDAVELTDEQIDAILEEVTVTQPQEVTIKDALLTDMQASFKSDKRVFIYHSHAREGWHAVDGSDKNANSKDVNITLLGEKLAEELAATGIQSIVSTTDYATAVPDYEWAYSYKYSRKSVKEVLAAHENIDMVFDLHRDSQPRQYTTTTINGEDYAQLYFIIGKRNENWQRNEAFATRLNEKMDELYPGLSRGIWGKNANSGNGEYNQSLHEKNVLIEVGGVDNTLEENYRTIKALAHVISLIAKEDEQT